jgi:hypothetical protein
MQKLNKMSETLFNELIVTCELDIHRAKLEDVERSEYVSGFFTAASKEVEQWPRDLEGECYQSAIDLVRKFRISFMNLTETNIVNLPLTHDLILDEVNKAHSAMIQPTYNIIDYL